MSLYYPSLNPIVLAKCDGYSQPFNLADKTAIVLIEDLTDSYNVSVGLKNELGQTVKPYSASLELTVGAFKFRMFNIDFQGLSEGLYKLSIIASARDASELKSIPLCLKENHSETVAIQATNTDNIQDIPFEDGVSFFYRVQGGFFDKALSPKSDDTSYQNEDADFVLLSSVPYESYKLNIGGTGGVPDYMQRLFNRVFSLDTIDINGEPFTKLEGAEWSAIEEDEYGFRSWELEVVRTENLDSELVVEYKDVAFWHDYVCQLSSSLDYVFLFTDNEDVSISKSLPNVGGQVLVAITSLQAGLQYENISVQGLPSWATLLRSGDDFILSAQSNTNDAKVAYLTFTQGESGKTIELQLIQYGTEVFDPYVAYTDDGVTTAIIGGNTYLS